MPSPESPAKRTTAFLMSTSGRGTADSVIVFLLWSRTDRIVTASPRLVGFRTEGTEFLRDAQSVDQGESRGRPADQRTIGGPLKRLRIQRNQYPVRTTRQPAKVYPAFWLGGSTNNTMQTAI